MSEGNPAPAPAPAAESAAPKVKKVVRIVREAAPASQPPTPSAKKAGAGVLGSALGIVGGLLLGGALAVGVVMLVRRRQQLTEFLFPSSPGNATNKEN